MELEIEKYDTKIIGNIAIFNVGGRDDIWRGGDLPFTVIEIRSGWRIDDRRITVYNPISGEPCSQNDIYYGPYHIIVLNVGWNGDIVKLSIEVSEDNTFAGYHDIFQSEAHDLLLKENEPYIYENLLITHNGGVQKIAFDWSDPCNVNLTLKRTDTGIERSYRSLYANKLLSPNADIKFEWYIMRILEITTYPFDVTMKIKKYLGT